MLPQNGSQLSSTPPTEDRKRKRDVLSCLDCRRRKLKCDRGLPACARCVKGGIASSCTYQSFVGTMEGHQDGQDASADEDGRVEKRVRASLNAHPSNELVQTSTGHPGVPIQSMSTFPAHLNTMGRLESRLARLEGKLAQYSTDGQRELDERSFAKTTSEMKNPRFNELETSVFKGRGFRTQFYGASNPTSLLAHFPEVRTFMKEARQDSALARLQSECNVIDARLKDNLSKIASAPNSNLLGLVPERAVADHFVHMYFDTFEFTYRILHRNTFWREYESFWISPGKSSPGFLPSLLLVIAIVRCMSPQEPLSFDRDGSSMRTEAIRWIQACDFWLKQQSQKHRFMAMYQVMCLRLLAASANCLKTKTAYIEAEALLNYCKSAGMHRDPRLLDERCSPFEMEMRRRLWATMVELELQASIDRGMPSSLSSISVDCPPPLNINDKDFTEASEQLPTSSTSEEFTDTSFLVISSKSLSLRTSICSLINDPSSHLAFDDVLRYEQQIIEALDSIPKWKSREATQASVLLDLQLRQLLLLIHTPFSRQTGSPQHRYSRMVCFETAKNILDQHSNLISTNNFTISLVRDDIYRAALSICHNAFLCSLCISDIFFQGILANIALMLEQAFKILEEKCMRRGAGFYFYWHVSAAWSLVQLKLGHESYDIAKLHATDRVAKLYLRAVPSQEGAEKSSTIPPSPTLSRSEGVFNGPASWFYSANVLGFTNNENDGPFDYSDTFDNSDWTLDNLWPLEGQQELNLLS